MSSSCASVRLTAEQLKTASVGPSNLTLLGLLRHMVEVERFWFRVKYAHHTGHADFIRERLDGFTGP